MKVGYTNLISTDYASASGTTGVTNTSYIQDIDTLKVCTMVSGSSIDVTLDANTSLDFIGVFNYDGASFKITVTDSASGTTEFTRSCSASAGFDYSNYYISLASVTNAISKINFENTSDASADIGFLWSGEAIDFNCAEALQCFDNSNDDVDISRANQSYYDDSYLFQTFNVTLQKENKFEDLRTDIRKILKTGYANPRPFIFEDEPIFDNDEICLGVLTSGKIGYDFFQVDANTVTLSQCTFEIREVF
jgi:hypothetical protein